MSALTDPWDDLDEHLADLDEHIQPDRIDDLLADRMVRHVARHRRQLAADQAAAAAEIERIGEWLEKRRAAHDTTYVESCLRQFHEARLAQDQRLRTIHLPAGTLRARKLPDRWDFADGFVTWAQRHRPDLVRTKVEVDRPAAKKALDLGDVDRLVDPDTGELLVRVEPGGVSFTVQTGDDT